MKLTVGLASIPTSLALFLFFCAFVCVMKKVEISHSVYVWIFLNRVENQNQTPSFSLQVVYRGIMKVPG